MQNTRQKMYGQGVRLPKDRVHDGVLDLEVASAVVGKATESIMATYFQGIAAGYSPRLRVRVEPNRIAYDLIVDESLDGMDAKYLTWRVDTFREGEWRVNVPEALQTALARWARREYDHVVMADDQRVWLADS
jgi:hypothetical protein